MPPFSLTYCIFPFRFLQEVTPELSSAMDAGCKRVSRHNPRLYLRKYEDVTIQTVKRLAAVDIGKTDRWEDAFFLQNNQNETKMPTLYKYHLEKYAGRSTRHKCPACGRVQSFSYYVDENNRPAGTQYGRCNHTGCGYILYPSGIAATSPDVPTHTAPPPPPIYYTKDEVKRYRAAAFDNPLIAYMAATFYRPYLERVCKDYCIGSIDNAVIFWQIDECYNIHRGKVMWYTSDAHRVKLKRADGSDYGKVQMMWKYLNHDRDREPDMCYFGQHLAALYPNKPIAIVESEKTAIVMSYYYPNFIWVATMSLSNFRAYRLGFLGTRQAIVFPDCDGYSAWNEQAQKIRAVMPDARLTVDDFIVRYASGKQDLADLFLKYGIDISEYFNNEMKIYSK